MSTLDRSAAGIPEWDLSDRLRKALRHAHLDRDEIANYLGVHRNTVGHWLRGSHQPSRSTLISWALLCGVPFEWLAYGTDTPSPGPGPSVIEESSSACTRSYADLALVA